MIETPHDLGVDEVSKKKYFVKALIKARKEQQKLNLGPKEFCSSKGRRVGW